MAMSREETALFIQDACNPLAIVRSFAACASRDLRDPVNVLFISKLTSLFAVNSSCIGTIEDETGDLFRTAYAEAQRRVASGETTPQREL